MGVYFADTGYEVRHDFCASSAVVVEAVAAAAVVSCSLSGPVVASPHFGLDCNVSGNELPSV
jgi:hypothetical protein